MNRAGIVAALVALASATGCTDPVTEIVLEVDGDLSVPDQIDRVEITVTGPEDGEPRVAEADLTAQALPRILTLVHRNGPLGPWSIRVGGYAGATEVVVRELLVTFEPEESLRLRVMLSAACATPPPCGSDQTCADGRCRPTEVGPCEYEGRDCGDGGLPDAETPLDAGSPDACTGGDERCNGVDDDCDGEVDEGFDLDSDPLNCGRCGRACPTEVENGTGSSCELGACVLSCAPEYGDCNRDPGDGCETNTGTTMDHCGACDAFCPAAGTFHAADAVCSGGRCLLSCDADWGDCDEDRSTGCETHVSVDRLHCGTCNNPCPDGQMCRTGACS